MVLQSRIELFLSTSVRSVSRKRDLEATMKVKQPAGVSSKQNPICRHGHADYESNVSVPVYKVREDIYGSFRRIV